MNDWIDLLIGRLGQLVILFDLLMNELVYFTILFYLSSSKIGGVID